MTFSTLFLAATVYTIMCLTINPVQSQESCGDPPKIDNAKHNGKKESYNHTERVQYRCNEGYARSGYPYVTCKSGQWEQHSMPTVCKIKSCGWPGDVANGRISSYLFSVGQYVRFICDDGYEVKGNTNRLCLITAKWSGRVPTCERVRCPRLRLSHGKVTDNGIMYKDTARFTCDEEYELKGSEERTCEANKHWSGEQTECKEIICQKPEIEFGRVDVEEPITYGTLATFRCNDTDRTLVGEQISACSGINKWSQTFPKCIETCRLPNVDNGKVLQKGWFGRYKRVEDDRIQEGGSLYVQCDYRYVLQPKRRQREDRREITCRKGIWADVPSCQPPDCSRVPVQPYNGEAKVTGQKHGDEVTYTCDAGYRLTGAWRRKCLFGRWSGGRSTCQEIYCPSVKLENREVKVISGGTNYRQDGEAQYRHGSQIEILCRAGYEVSETSVTDEEKWRCFNSTWEKTGPIECKPESCRNQEPKNPANGEADVTGQNHGDTVTYSCYSGYLLEGERKRTCSFGKWTDTPPTCTERQCDDLSREPDHSSVRVSGYTTGSVRTFTCDMGYEMDGESTQKCHQGKWLGSVPNCQEAGCWLNADWVEKIDNSDSKNFYGAGENVTLSCRESQYVLKKNISEATCEKGEWHPSRPTCIGAPCSTSVHGPIDGGQIRYNSSAVDLGWINDNDVATVICDEGYQIDGPKNQTCKYGEWVPKDLPVTPCMPASCEFRSFEEDIETVSHQDIREVSCPQGYHILRDHDEERYERTVMASCLYGEWLPIVPECQPDGCLLPRLQNVQFCLSNGTCRAEGIIPHGTRVSAGCRDRFTWNDTSINNMVSLSCSLGDLRGGKYSNCITDGVGCADPGTANNSDRTANWPIHGSYFSPGDTLTYSCHQGHLIDLFDQSQDINCLENGRWSQEVPVCSVDCGNVPEVYNAVIMAGNRTNYIAGDTVQYQCKDDLIETAGADMNVTCNSQGNWDTSKVICKGRRCTVPVFNINGNLQVNYYNEDGYRVNVPDSGDVKPGIRMLSRCKTFYRYRFEGSSRRVCDRGEWTGQEPNCYKNVLRDGKAPNAIYYVQKDYYKISSGTVTISDEGELKVTARTTLHLCCYSSFPLKWKLPPSLADCESTRRCKKSSSRYVHDYTYTLTLYNMDRSYTGNYSCYAPDQDHYRREFRITIVSRDPLWFNYVRF